MIDKLFDRFKPAMPDKPPPPTSENLLFKMLSFSLKLENDDKTLLKISRTLSFNLDVDTVCISTITQNEIHLRQVFHNGENCPIKSGQWQIESNDLEITSQKQETCCDAIKQTLSNDTLINPLNAATTCCIPAIDENNTSATFINLYHSQQKNYSHYENEILKLMAQRAALFFQYEKQAANTEIAQQYDESDLSQALKQTRAQLTTADKSLKSLSFAMSHELRAPLRCMDTFSKALVEDFAEHLPNDATSHIYRIRKACLNMGHMVDDLLWLTRVSRGKTAQESINFSKLAKKIANDLVSTEEQIVITINIQPNLSVIGDKSLLKIALQHLFSNAIKFSRQQEKIVIDFFSEEQEGTPVFAIRDNGHGFDMAYYDQLFEPFKQLHSSHKFVGTGIGLATVERIIARHGGKIWAQSDVNEGATFYFTLPKPNSHQHEFQRS